jgi:predicted AAA+ superfamily ATPase
METKRRFFQDPGTSFFLFGPRGTGKTTWLRTRLPHALFLDLLSPEVHRLYSARPERLRHLPEGNPDKTIVVIDDFFDAGVFRSLWPAGPLDRPQEIDGAALEGLVAQHLRAWNAYRGDQHNLYFWRTRSGNEVDFVVYGPDGLWALEVKNAAAVHPGDLRGLRAFREDYPEARCACCTEGPSG